MAEDWITTNEAAQISGYQPAHVRLLIRRGEVNGMKWGRDWMISRESLESYLKRIQSQGNKRGPKRN
jgi:excisionase family DNA binding protein